MEVAELIGRAKKIEKKKKKNENEKRPKLKNWYLRTNVRRMFLEKRPPLSLTSLSLLRGRKVLKTLLRASAER